MSEDRAAVVARKKSSWFNIGIYALISVASTVLFVGELFRDDPRWWKLLLEPFVALMMGSWAVAELRKGRPRR